MVAAAVVGGAVLGAGASIYSSNKAAGAQKNASNNATDAQLQMYNQTREDQAPYRAVGNSALSQLAYGVGSPLSTDTASTNYGGIGQGDFNKKFTLADYQADPGYQFRLDQGTQALERSAAARGGLLSGGTLKDLTDYQQGAASQEYGNAYNRFNNDQSSRFNRLASLAGIGQTSNNSLANVGANTANNIGNNIIGAGNATAAGYVGSANALNGAIGQGMSAYSNNQLLNRFAPASNNSSYTQNTADFQPQLGMK